MSFISPRTVNVASAQSPSLTSGQVRVRTIASGISAGTEMTAFRGTNPYLTSTWDPKLKLFTDAHPNTLSYPLEAWGYSEVGTVIEVAADSGAEVDPGSIDPADVVVGDVVWGIWGHRSEGVLPRSALRGHRLPAGLDARVGCFVRVGAIALNAVLGARCGVGDTVAIFGQGVIGLLATHFAKLSGSTVIAVDAIAGRRRMAESVADHVLAPDAGTAVTIRHLTNGRGADVAIELSGSYAGLRDAIRAVGPDSTVVAAGFYQGPATPIVLGEEFHHNRVTVVASQIGAVPAHLYPRWDRERLLQTVVSHLIEGRPDVRSLISHSFALADAQAAYDLLDTQSDQALQVLLESE